MSASFADQCSVFAFALYPARLQPPYCIVKPWSPIPPRPASPFPLLSGQPRHFLEFAGSNLAQHAEKFGMLFHSSTVLLPPLLRSRQMPAPAVSASPSGMGSLHCVCLKRCTQSDGYHHVEDKFCFEAMTRAEHSSHPLFERSATIMMEQP